MNAPIQLAAEVLLEQRKVVQPVLLDRVRTNLAELDRRLAQQKTCQRLEVEGGWYAVLRVPVTQSDEDLAIAILNRSIRAGPSRTLLRFPQRWLLDISLLTPPAEFRDGTERMLGVVQS